MRDSLRKHIAEREQSRREIAEREQQVRTLAENSPDLVVRHDREGCYRFANPAFRPSDRALPCGGDFRNAG